MSDHLLGPGCAQVLDAEGVGVKKVQQVVVLRGGQPQAADDAGDAGHIQPQHQGPGHKDEQIESSLPTEDAAQGQKDLVNLSK